MTRGAKLFAGNGKLGLLSADTHIFELASQLNHPCWLIAKLDQLEVLGIINANNLGQRIPG
jgi:hypothetical protein